MPSGEVKWFDNRRGWGYLKLEDGSEVFVHQRDIETKGFRALQPGQRVACELGKSDDGRPRALKVRPLG